MRTQIVVFLVVQLWRGSSFKILYFWDATFTLLFQKKWKNGEVMRHAQLYAVFRLLNKHSYDRL